MLATETPGALPSVFRCASKVITRWIEMQHYIRVL